MNIVQDEEPIHQDLRNRGWRQGCLLPHDLSMKLCREYDLPSSKQWRLFVITHSCDLLRDAEREPYVEIIAGLEAERVDPRCVHGRNPRILHLDADCTSIGRCLVFEATNRRVCDKVTFRGYSPEPEAGLIPSARRILVKWIARRYLRDAFPDEFNKRLAQVERRLEKLWKSPEAEFVTGIYISGADTELPPDQVYNLDIRLTAESDSWDNPRGDQALKDVKIRLEEILEGCDGFGDCEVLPIPENDFPISNLRLYKRLDKDYRSYPEADELRLPPNQIDGS